jgi:hypothetical protein
VSKYEKLYNFNGTVHFDKHGRITWTFRNSVWRALNPHKARERRRLTSGGTYVTPAGVARG